MNCLLVFFGGGLGAVVRYLIYLFLPKNCALPFCTLLANFLGCFIAVVVFTYFILKADTNSIYKTLLITGFCGGLSTLSALTIESMVFIQNGAYLKALSYIALSVLICIVAVFLGIMLVKKIVQGC